jgi:hypothetical protein
MCLNQVSRLVPTAAPQQLRPQLREAITSLTGRCCCCTPAQLLPLLPLTHACRQLLRIHKRDGGGPTAGGRRAEVAGRYSQQVSRLEVVQLVLGHHWCCSAGAPGDPGGGVCGLWTSVMQHCDVPVVESPAAACSGEASPFCAVCSRPCSTSCKAPLLYHITSALVPAGMICCMVWYMVFMAGAAAGS